MTIFVTLILVVLTFIFISHPFLKRTSHFVPRDEDDKLQELYSKRDNAYSMLKKLARDFQAGILTEEDYGSQEAKYKRKVQSIIRNIDELEKATDEIDTEIEQQVLELRKSKGWFCPQCSTKYQKSDRLCSHCGISLCEEESS